MRSHFALVLGALALASYATALPRNAVSEDGYNYDAAASNTFDLAAKNPFFNKEIDIEETGYGRDEPSVPFATGFIIDCEGDNRVCVGVDQCSNGFVAIPGFVKEESRKCEINREVCCTLQDQEYVSSNSDNIPSFGTILIENNGYLPPHDSDSSNIDNVVAPPNQLPPFEPSTPRPTSARLDLGPQIAIQPQLGCAAALLCVEEQYCTAAGVISKTPQVFTEQQLLRRVPMVDCRNPESGIIGKCCRDPDYVDPWPTGNLPADYKGGFDEQGFPNFLNLSRKVVTPRPIVRPAPTTQFVDFQRFTSTTQRPVPVVVTTERPLVIPVSITRPVIPVNFRPVTSTTTQTPFIFGALASGQPNPFFVSSTITPTPAPIQHVFVSRPTPPAPILEVQSTDVKDFIVPHEPGAQCGLINKIVRRPSKLGDIDAAYGEIPWQAMILNTARKQLICGGTIIATNMVLTSASCVEGLEPSVIAVKAGEWKLGYELKHEEPLNYTISTVQHIIRHPGYVEGGKSFDLAVLYLETPFVFDQHIDAICISEVQPSLAGRKCIATGWGQEVIKYHLAGALMHKIDVDVISDDEAKERISIGGVPLEYDDSFVCGKAHQPEVSMCHVDIGGPLACDRGDGYYELVGVYSRDNGCSIQNQVTIFSLVDVAWVRQVLIQPFYYIQQFLTAEQPQTAAPIILSSTQKPLAHFFQIQESQPATASYVSVTTSTTTPEPDCECNKRKLAAAAAAKIQQPAHQSVAVVTQPQYQQIQLQPIQLQSIEHQPLQLQSIETHQVKHQPIQFQSFETHQPVKLQSFETHQVKHQPIQLGTIETHQPIKLQSFETHQVKHQPIQLGTIETHQPIKLQSFETHQVKHQPIQFGTIETHQIQPVKTQQHFFQVQPVQKYNQINYKVPFQTIQQYQVQSTPKYEIV